MRRFLPNDVVIVLLCICTHRPGMLFSWYQKTTMDRFILLENDSRLLLASSAASVRSHVAVLCSLVMLQHFSLFQEGKAPSEALKLMAETGDVSALLVSALTAIAITLSPPVHIRNPDNHQLHHHHNHIILVGKEADLCATMTHGI